MTGPPEDLTWDEAEWDWRCVRLDDLEPDDLDVVDVEIADRPF